MIWCWGTRPAAIVPESAAQSGGVNWRSVFCHELAHLVRRDHWSALWAEVLVIALPWQPLAWRSRRRLAFLREQSCDDWVLAAGGEADRLRQVATAARPATVAGTRAGRGQQPDVAQRAAGAHVDWRCNSRAQDRIGAGSQRPSLLRWRLSLASRWLQPRAPSKGSEPAVGTSESRRNQDRCRSPIRSSFPGRRGE